MPADIPTLIGIPYSPWSEKARWALDHHGVRYRFEEYLPLLGELGLRMRLRKQRDRGGDAPRPGPASVPVLVGEAGPIAGSFEIAREAERLGGGSPLFPDGALDEIQRWDERSEEGLRAGRAAGVPRLAASSEAKRESLPAFIPGVLRPLAAPMAGLGMWFVARKYALADGPGDDALEGALLATRKALDGGKLHLLDVPSYADITMAVVLQFVAPVEDRWIRLGPGQRVCWTRPELAERFADLVGWRDELYARWRTGSSAWLGGAAPPNPRGN